MKVTHVEVNRAPVLTLWAAVVAERMGFDSDEALTLGRGLAGLNAQSKGQSLGIFHPAEHKAERARERKPGERILVQLLGRGVPAIRTEEGIRAVANDRPADPASVQRYLESKFGEHLDDVQGALRTLAKAFAPQELSEVGFGLYEKFRPEVPAGKKGWGAKGDLDLEKIRSLARAA